ncbi:hypothetical protein D3C80_1334470 [compost metagenome]
MRRNPVLAKDVDGFGPHPLHAVVEDLRHGRPAVLEGQGSGNRPRPDEHDPHRPLDPWHLSVRQRRRQAGGDLPVVLVDERRAENAAPTGGKTRETGAGCTEKDLPESRHRRADHRRPDHRFVGSRPAFPRRVQRRPARPLPLQPAHVRPLHAGRHASRTARDLHRRRRRFVDAGLG